MVAKYFSWQLKHPIFDVYHFLAMSSSLCTCIKEHFWRWHLKIFTGNKFRILEKKMANTSKLDWFEKKVWKNEKKKRMKKFLIDFYYLF